MLARAVAVLFAELTRVLARVSQADTGRSTPTWLLSTTATLCALGFGMATAGSAIARTSNPVIASTLRVVAGSYLFEDQLDAAALLGAALEAAENAVPEIKATQVSPRAYLLEAADCQLRLEVQPAATLAQLSTDLDVAAALIERCVSKLPENLAAPHLVLLNGLLAKLDPYSTVFDNRGRAEHAIQFRGKLAGIGARIGIRRDKLSLITVYSGSPAAQAGLRNRDSVTRIDGVSTTNMEVSDAVERIRGDVGTTVVLTIEREEVEEPLAISVTRGLVTIPSVEAQRLRSGNLYANISHFSQSTPSDFEKNLAELFGDDRSRGVVIDLRANSGGSMLGASAIADAFLDSGLLITTAGRYGKSVPGLTGEVQATSRTPFREAPIVILTSPRTASGAELMAASLRNHDRALIVGQRTFGKGTVQKTYAIGHEEALKLTVGNFLPNGLAIPAGGLVPDVEIRNFVVSQRGHRLPVAREADSDLPYWLRNPSWLAIERERNPVKISFVRKLDESTDDSDHADEDEEIHDDPEADPAVRIADEILQRHGSIFASKMLVDSSSLLAMHARQADDTAIALLDDEAIDWTPSPATLVQPDDVSLRNQLRVGLTPSGEPLVAGADAALDLRVTNISATPLHQLFAALDSDIGFLMGHGTMLGLIGPGKTITRKIRVKLPTDLRTARLSVGVRLEDEHGRSAEFGTFHVVVEGLARPQLALRARASPGPAADTLALIVEVANRGDADAGEIRILAEHPEAGVAELVTGSATLPSLAPKSTAAADLAIRLLTSAEEIPALTLDLIEQQHRIFVKTEVALASGQSEWLDPPRVELVQIMEPQPAGSYSVIAEITDDRGLAAAWASVDGEKIDYFDMSSSQPLSRQLRLPWDPKEGRRYEIFARDVDGLLTRFVTEL